MDRAPTAEVYGVPAAIALVASLMAIPDESMPFSGYCCRKARRDVILARQVLCESDRLVVVSNMQSETFRCARQ